MNNVGIVTAAGIKNAFRNKTVLLIMISITLICVIGVTLLLCLLLIDPEVKKAVPDRGALEGYLGLMIYSSTLISIGVTLNSLVFQTMVKEKNRGNLTALLATPLKASDIWLGKSLALFIPGLILAIILAAVSWLIVNLVYFLPNIGFVFSLEMAVNSLIALPLMYLFFGMLVHLVGLTAKPVTGNVIAQIFLPVIANVVIQLVAHDVVNANSWQFMVVNLGTALVIGCLVLIFKPRLTPERIVLSG